MSKSRSSASETALWANPSMLNVLLTLMELCYCSHTVIRHFNFFLKVFIISFQAYGEISYGWIVSFDIIICACLYIYNHTESSSVSPRSAWSLSQYVIVLFILKVDRFLMKCISRPQQLSTYALTLYKYTTTINGQTILVGKFGKKNCYFSAQEWHSLLYCIFCSFIIELHIIAHI